MKAEPESRMEKGVDVKFSIDDLREAKEPEPWDGMFIILSVCFISTLLDVVADVVIGVRNAAGKVRGISSLVILRLTDKNIARNNMRAMRKGDLAFFYHSNCKVPGIAGVMEIVQEHSVDGMSVTYTLYLDP